MGGSDTASTPGQQTPPALRQAADRAWAEAVRLAREGRHADANATLHQLLSLQAHALGDRHPDYTATLLRLADLQAAAGELHSAEPLYRQSFQIRREIFGDDHPATAEPLAGLAQLLRRKGEDEAAEELYGQALGILREGSGAHAPTRARLLGQLADFHWTQGKPADAEPLLSEASQILEGYLGTGHAALVAVLGNLGTIATRRGDFDRAGSWYRRALALGEPIPDKDNPVLAEILLGLAAVLHRQGNSLEAEELVRRAQTIAKKHPPEHQSGAFDSLHDLGLLLWTRGELSAARLLFREALGLIKAVRGEDHVDYARTLSAFGALQLEMGDPEKAESLLWQAHELFGAANQDESLDHADNLIGLGELYRSRGVLRRTEQCWRLALAIREHHLGRSHPDSAIARGCLVEVLRQLGDPEASALSQSETNLDPGTTSRSDAYHVPALPEIRWRPFDEIDAAIPWDRLTEEFSTQSGSGPNAAADQPAPRPEPQTLPSERADAVTSSAATLPMSPDSRLTAETPPIFDRTSPMPYSSNELSQELAGLSDRFSELGEQLISAARRLHAPGVLPREELWNAYTACRDDFHGLREYTRELADSLLISVPAVEQLDSLQAINDLLDEAAEAEIRRSRSDELRGRALSVLDRVLSLSHATHPDFAPLHDLREQARGLHQDVSASAWNQPHPETESLAEGDHPLSHLLNLVDDRDELHDEHWAHFHESVSHHFGKPLAAAAARGKLSVNTGEEYGQHSQNHVGAGRF